MLEMHWGWTFLLASGYGLLIFLVSEYLTGAGNTSIVWLPGGLGLAALLLGGKKYWVGVFAGALLGYWLATDFGWIAITGVALFQCVLGALLGVWLLERMQFRSQRFNVALQHPRDFVLLMMVGVVSAAVASAGSIGVQLFSGEAQPMTWGKSYVYGWMGNILGIVLFTPLLLVCRKFPWFLPSSLRLVEAGLCFGLAFLYGQAAFMGWFPDWIGLIPHDYGMFLFVAWGAVRFGRGGALLLVLMTAIQAMLGVLSQIGEFSQEIAETGLIYYWFYIMTLAAVGTTLALIIKERDRAEVELRESESKLQAILDNAPVGIWLVGVDGQYRFVNKTFRDAIGLTHHQSLTTSQLPDFLGTHAAASCIRTDIEAIGHAEPQVSQETLVLVDGVLHQIEVTKARLLDAEGEISGVIGISIDVTQRKQAEVAAEISRNELKRQSELLQTTLESIDQGYAVWDADDRLVVWNSKCVEFWYQPEQVRVGMPRQELLLHIARNEGLGPGDPQILAQARGQSIQGEVEDVFTLKDGRVIYVRRYRMPEGRYAAVYTDITQRRAAEEALRRSEERWKFALEGAGDAVWDRNLQTGDGVYSRRWREMLGYGGDDEWDDTEDWIRYVHPEDSPGLAEAMQAHLNGKAPTLVHEQRVQCKDGSWKWILTRGMLVSRDAQGQPLRLIGTHSDITEYKQMQRLQIYAVLESSAEAKLLVAHDGVICYANSAASKVFGYTPQQFMGMKVELLVPDELRSGHEMLRESFVRSPVSRPIGFSQTLLARRKDGKTFPAELGLSPLSMDNRMVVMASIVDITERKKAEDMLRAQKESAEEALERAKMAERKIINISEETRERIGQELHDNLGQHLTGVAFLSEVLSTKLKKEGWEEMTLVSKITTLLNEAILNTKQLAQGLYPVELKAVGLQAMLGQLANQIRSIYKIDCEVGYDERFDPSGPDVAINLFRIAQEAVNNAIKHGAASRISIRTQVTDDGSAMEIADNGRGLSGQGEHGGLGMHTMQYRATMVGARLYFSVSPMGGTSVVVSFPIEEVENHVV